MKRYFLVRHGETDLNVSGVFYGHTDCPINAKGEKQAREIGRYLSKVKLDKAFVSPLIRANYTKDIIIEENQYGLAAIEGGPEALLFDDRLKEIGCGLWENKSVDEIKEMNPEYWEVFTKGWPNAAMPNGESFMDLYKRMNSFFDHRIRKAIIKNGSAENGNQEVENILVVGHHGSIGLFLLITMGLKVEDYWKFRIEQGVYSVITENNGRFCVEKINTKGTAQ